MEDYKEIISYQPQPLEEIHTTLFFESIPLFSYWMGVSPAVSSKCDKSNISCLLRSAQRYDFKRNAFFSQEEKNFENQEKQQLGIRLRNAPEFAIKVMIYLKQATIELPRLS